MPKTVDAVSTRLTEKEVEQIAKLVKMGYYLNVSDFVRSSIREKLENVKILYVRDVDVSTAKRDIMEYIRKVPQAYPSDIAMELGLDMPVVMEAIDELMQEGRVSV